MFHARGPAAAKDRSPSDDVVRGTATELDEADLKPGLTIAAADGVIRSARYDGASPYMQRCTIIHSLYSMRCLTGTYTQIVIRNCEIYKPYLYSSLP